MFPVEILEIFIKYSDGADVINFRGVCKTWNEIIVRLSKDTNLWRVKCGQEIPIHHCRSIHEKLYPKMSWLELHRSVDNLIWLNIYQSWLRWHRLKKSKFSKEQFEPFFIRLPCVTITCLAVLENLVAVGSSEGFITFYNIDSSTTEPILIADQKEYVSSVTFLKEGTFRYNNAGNGWCFQNFFTASPIPLSAQRERKRNQSHFCIEYAQSDVVEHHNARSHWQTRIWNINEVESEQDVLNIINSMKYCTAHSTTHGRIWKTTGYQLTVRSKNEERTYDFVQLHGTIVALAADGEQALLWTDVGFNYEIDLNDPDSQYIEQYVTPPAEKVCKYYLFRHWVAMCITADGILGISVNSKPWKMYNILPHLHGYPTSVLYYASTLVLGLDSGSMHIYHVKDIESLTNWHFRSRNSKAITIDNQALIVLDIMERPDKQYMIAATSNKVTIIKFRGLPSK